MKKYLKTELKLLDRIKSLPLLRWVRSILTPLQVCLYTRIFLTSLNRFKMTYYIVYFTTFFISGFPGYVIPEQMNFITTSQYKAIDYQNRAIAGGCQDVFIMTHSSINENEKNEEIKIDFNRGSAFHSNDDSLFYFAFSLYCCDTQKNVP